MQTRNRHPSSFRDPSGYIFNDNGTILRHVDTSYFKQFSVLHDSGLYDKLTQKGQLIAHELIKETPTYKILLPEQLGLISFPYEWSFSQLRDAALLTLEIHATALEHGMVLKDATSFNVQFHKGKPIFIDTLSFDIYSDGDPWMAYGQFCRFFLAPLLLMKYIAPDLNKLLIPYIDGVPLEITSAMLPNKTHFSPFIKANIHMHAKAFSKHKDTFATEKKPKLKLSMQKNIIINTMTFISSLKLDTQTEWGDYYNITNYDDDAFKFKEDSARAWINKYNLKTIWDIGGNNGHFTRLIQDSCDLIICTDLDPIAVDENYRLTRKNGESKISPLMVDFTNPSPGVGFANKERSSFVSRIQDIQIDCIMALALIHHLSISANCNFEMLAESFSQTSRYLLIEFVDPADSWAEKLLRSKRNAMGLFSFYNKANFESAFTRLYDIKEMAEVPDSQRTLYMMSRKAG